MRLRVAAHRESDERPPEDAARLGSAFSLLQTAHARLQRFWHSHVVHRSQKGACEHLCVNRRRRRLHAWATACLQHTHAWWPRVRPRALVMSALVACARRPGVP
eukprot:6161378-Pleurochrysis_carterae.AAC.1